MPPEAARLAEQTIASNALPALDDPKYDVPKAIASSATLTGDQLAQVKDFFERDADRTSVQWLTASNLYGGIPMLKAISSINLDAKPAVTSIDIWLPSDVAGLTGCGVINLVTIGDSSAIPEPWVGALTEIVEDIAKAWPPSTLTSSWLDDAGRVTFESAELRIMRASIRERLDRAGIAFIDEPWHPQTDCDTPLPGSTFTADQIVVSHDDVRTISTLCGTTRIVQSPSTAPKRLGDQLATRLCVMDQAAASTVGHVIRLSWESALRRVGQVATRHDPNLEEHDPLEAGRRVSVETVEKLNPNIDRLTSKAIEDLIHRLNHYVVSLADDITRLVYNTVDVDGPLPIIKADSAGQELKDELSERLTSTRKGTKPPASPPPGLARRFLTNALTPEVQSHAHNHHNGQPGGVIGYGIQTVANTATDLLITGTPQPVQLPEHWQPAPNIYPSSRSHIHDPKRGYELYCTCGWQPI